MFGLLTKKNKKGQEIVIKIDGMHCTSCAVNIDDMLEETDGVYSANTSYAKSHTKVLYDQEKINVNELLQVIRNAGYEAKY